MKRTPSNQLPGFFRSGIVRFVFLLALGPVALAQVHHPSWWAWVEPESSALVGIRWDALRTTKAGVALETALFAPAGLALPAIECLKQSDQLVLSAPRIEAIFWGGCTASQLRDQALRKGFRKVVFEETELWTSPTWTLVHLSGKLVLVGPRKLVEETLEGAASEEGRRYSPLLARAAQWKDRNLWIVSQGTQSLRFAAFSDLEDQANHPEPVELVPPAKQVAKSEPIRMLTGMSAVMVTPALTQLPTADVPKPTSGTVALAPPRRVIRITGLDEGPREIELPRR